MQQPTDVSSGTMQSDMDDTEPIVSMEVFRLQRIYFVAGLFILTGLLQLAVIKAFGSNMTDAVAIPSFMWLIIALVCLILLVFTELFNKFPINWTLGIVAVESVTLCIICFSWNQLPLLTATIIVVTVIVFNVFLYLLGAFLPLIVLPGYTTMMVATIVFIIGYILLNIIVFAVKKVNLMAIVDSWAILYTIALILYTATLIHQRRLPNMLSEEYVLSATVIASFLLHLIHLLTSVVTR